MLTRALIAFVDACALVGVDPAVMAGVVIAAAVGLTSAVVLYVGRLVEIDVRIEFAPSSELGRP